MTLQNLKMRGAPRKVAKISNNAARLRAFRARHGVQMASVVPLRTMAAAKELKRELGLTSQRALLVVAIDVLAQTVARGALRKVES